MHKDGPELHVEDDGVASEEAHLLCQQGSLLRPGLLVTLEPRQLQTAALGLQTQALIFLAEKGTRTKSAIFPLFFKDVGRIARMPVSLSSY